MDVWPLLVDECGGCVARLNLFPFTVLRWGPEEEEGGKAEEMVMAPGDVIGASSMAVSKSAVFLSML